MPADDGRCPDCNEVVFYPPNRPGEDHAWKRHFDFCEPHIRRAAIKDGEACSDCEEMLDDPEFHCQDCGEHVDGSGECQNENCNV